MFFSTMTPTPLFPFHIQLARFNKMFVAKDAKQTSSEFSKNMAWKYKNLIDSRIYILRLPTFLWEIYEALSLCEQEISLCEVKTPIELRDVADYNIII